MCPMRRKDAGPRTRRRKARRRQSPCTPTRPRAPCARYCLCAVAPREGPHEAAHGCGRSLRRTAAFRDDRRRIASLTVLSAPLSRTKVESVPWRLETLVTPTHEFATASDDAAAVGQNDQRLYRFVPPEMKRALGGESSCAPDFLPLCFVALAFQTGTVVPLRASSCQFFSDLTQHIRTLIWLELVFPSAKLFTTS